MTTAFADAHADPASREGYRLAREQADRITDLEIELQVAAALFEAYLPLLPEGNGIARKIAEWRALAAHRPVQAMREALAA